MRTISVTAFIGVWALSGAAVQVGTSEADAAALMTKYKRQSCHSVDKKRVDPDFREIAQQYAGSVGAAASLADKVQNGSTGALAAAAGSLVGAAIITGRAILIALRGHDTANREESR
jgi:cytochrome c551/c552